ncbi:hypothetical protein BH09PAT2_BH09PAT2_00410 [soil metagenome]
MNFQYFSKTLGKRKESLKKLEGENAQRMMNREFAQLMDKHLTLPVSLYHL